MTEREWLQATDPLRMLEFLRAKVSDRKLRLFVVACCRRAYSLLSLELRQALRVAELLADGQVTDRQRKAARSAAMTAGRIGYHSGAAKYAVAVALRRKAADAAQFAFKHAGWLAAVSTWTAATGRPAAEAPAYGTDGWDEFAVLCAAEQRAQCDLIRDIIGNPFRPVAARPSWLAWNGRTIPKLAQSIYEDRAFDRLPILGDALEEAGCHDADILNHCRRPGEHVRGCWVVDLLLGKG
jgi:hypothetical protein